MPNLIGGYGPTILIGGWTLTGVAIFLFILRSIYARTIEGKLRWDYIWSIVSMIYNLGTMIPLTLAVYYGLGRHTGELTFPQLFVAAKWFYITLMIALAAVVFAKFTIIALLLTMHGITARKKRLALYFLAFLLVSTSTLPLAMILSHCKPVQKLWDLGLDGTCQSLGPYGDIAVFHGSFQVFIDVVLALWPISIVWNLQMPRRTKLSFCLLMAVSIAPTAAAIQRTILSSKSLYSDDLLYDFSKYLFFGTIEIWAVVIIGNIPPLRPLFLRVFFKKPSTSMNVTLSEKHGNKQSQQVTTQEVDNVDLV